MNKNNVYYHEKIKSIPQGNVRTMVETELRDLSFDLGKKVISGDQEFEYMVGRVVNTLSGQYPEWEMMYFDTCLKNGMLDEYDKGQILTVKRLLVWMAAFERSLHHSPTLKNDVQNTSLPDRGEDGELFSNKCSRFTAIYNFRVARKPEYQSDDWTLERIEQTEEFREWKRNHSTEKININHKIGNLVS